MDVDELSRSADGVRRVTVTARALLLTRDIRVQASHAEVFHPDRGFELPQWDHDTTFGGLGLSAAGIDGWRGKRVLDVASGLSLAGTELSSLGVKVDCVDLEVDDDHPAIPKVAEIVRARYHAELTRLRELVDSSPRYGMTAGQRGLLDRLVARADHIAATYPVVSGVRRQGEATTLAGFDDDRYAATLCGWLMVHLEPEDERRVVESMVRVTKPGGHIHLRAGYGGDAAARVSTWLGQAVEIKRACGDLVVLRRQASAA